MNKRFEGKCGLIFSGVVICAFLAASLWVFLSEGPMPAKIKAGLDAAYRAVAYRYNPAGPAVLERRYDKERDLTFYKELPKSDAISRMGKRLRDKVVSIPTIAAVKRASAKPEKGDYTVQILLVSSMSGAKAALSKLREQGFDDVYMVRDKLKKRKVFLIRTGAFKSKKEAKPARKRLRKRGYKDAWIVEVGSE